MPRKPLPRIPPRHYLPGASDDWAGGDARSRTASSCRRLESSPCDSSVLSPHRLKSLRPPLPSSVRRLLPQSGTDGLDSSIYGYILHYSLREQIYLVVVTLLSFPFLYYSLDLPKLIVNRAISGKDFPQKFMGWDFDQIPYLLVLCCIFLRSRFDKRVVQTASQREEGTSRRAHAAPSALSALRAGAAVSAAPFRSYRDRPGHRDDDRRAGAGRRVYRRRFRAADLAGRHAC